jgi:hypothetical protein
MKTTITIAHEFGAGRVIVETFPTRGGDVQLTVDDGCGLWSTVQLNQDQAGALIFGLEQAAEAAGVAKEMRDYIESRKVKNKPQAA